MRKSLVLASALFLTAPFALAQPDVPPAMEKTTPPTTQSPAIPPTTPETPTRPQTTPATPAPDTPAPPAPMPPRDPMGGPVTTTPPGAMSEAAPSTPATMGSCRTVRAQGAQCSCLKAPTVMGVSNANPNGGRNMCVTTEN